MSRDPWSHMTPSHIINSSGCLSLFILCLLPPSLALPLANDYFSIHSTATVFSHAAGSSFCTCHVHVRTKKTTCHSIVLGSSLLNSYTSQNVRYAWLLHLCKVAQESSRILDWGNKDVLTQISPTFKVLSSHFTFLRLLARVLTYMLPLFLRNVCYS